MFPPFKAVILDLDGLILDTETTYWRAWRGAAEKLGFGLHPSLFQRLSGQSIDQVATILTAACGPDFDFPRFHELSTRFWNEWVEAHGIDVQPGYETLMAVLHVQGIPYLLATNSQRRYAERCLRLAGIFEDFPEIVSRDEVGRGKPAPDIYLQAADFLSLPASRCLAVEDSFPGILAAARANALPILIPNQGKVTPEMVDLTIARFSSLGELAEAIDTQPAG